MFRLRVICACVCAAVIGFAVPSAADESAQAQNTPRKIVREDVPDIGKFKRVAGHATHSGFAVPRYVSLKFGKVNGRQGPSLKHPALWQYRKRGLPLVVVAEMDIWRKVRDMNGDESWVRSNALSGVRHVVTLGETSLHKKPRANAAVRAVTSPDTVLTLEDCNAEGWCQVKSKDGYKGWTQRVGLWGVEPL